MHFLYILYSPTADKYFTGEANNVPDRIELHNSHKNLKSFTGAAYDWETKLIFKCKSKEEAIFLEKFIKNEKSKEFIRQVIEKPEILKNILKNRNQ